MQYIGLGSNLGDGVQGASIQITYVDLQGTSGTGAKTLTLPLIFGQGSQILKIQVNLVTSFTAASSGFTTLTMSVGLSGGSNTQYTATTNLMATGGSGGTPQETAFPTMGYPGGSGNPATQQLTATFTPSSGGTLSTANAGQVNIDVWLLNVTTPTYTGLYTSQTID